MSKKNKIEDSKHKNDSIDEDINKLKNIIRREMSERQIAEEEIVKSLEEQKRYLLASSDELKYDVGRLENVKTEILGYTFQSVTIVVGLLAIILTLTFFWLNIDKLDSEFFGLFVGILVFFSGMLIIWFFVWLRNN